MRGTSGICPVDGVSVACLLYTRVADWRRRLMRFRRQIVRWWRHNMIGSDHLHARDVTITSAADDDNDDDDDDARVYLHHWDKRMEMLQRLVSAQQLKWRLADDSNADGSELFSSWFVTVQQSRQNVQLITFGHCHETEMQRDRKPFRYWKHSHPSFLCD